MLRVLLSLGVQCEGAVNFVGCRLDSYQNRKYTEVCLSLSGMKDYCLQTRFRTRSCCHLALLDSPGSTRWLGHQGQDRCPRSVASDQFTVGLLRASSMHEATPLFAARSLHSCTLGRTPLHIFALQCIPVRLAVEWKFERFALQCCVKKWSVKACGCKDIRYQ